jgi:prepilin-type N-terminal cleavage/methylation domain-containing protein
VQIKNKYYVLCIKYKNMKKKNAFTLFELLVSISIIAILVALATVSYSAAQRKARDSRRMQDMETIRKAAEQYYMLNSSNYPVAGWSAGSQWAVNTQTVLEAFPMDPKGVGYTAPSTPPTASAYCMCAYLENGNGNSGFGCVYSAVPKSWYCVNNQQ